MANRYFQPGSERSRRVHALFSRIAGRYDCINDLQSLGLQRYWKRRLLRLAQPQVGERALDLCCGTGDVAFGLAARGVEVVGLDFNLAMLGVAQRRKSFRSQQAAPRGSVTFVAGDAMRMPFADEVFDLVTVSYGLRNLPDLALALREIRRTLRPGGRLLVLDFGKPDRPVWRAFYLAYLRLVVPVFGRVFCGDADAYGYILESLRHYPSPAGLAEVLRQSGWGGIRVQHLFGGVMGLNEARRIPS